MALKSAFKPSVISHSAISWTNLKDFNLRNEQFGPTSSAITARKLASISEHYVSTKAFSFISYKTTYTCIVLEKRFKKKTKGKKTLRFVLFLWLLKGECNSSLGILSVVIFLNFHSTKQGLPLVDFLVTWPWLKSNVSWSWYSK